MTKSNPLGLVFSPGRAVGSLAVLCTLVLAGCGYPPECRQRFSVNFVIYPEGLELSESVCPQVLSVPGRRIFSGLFKGPGDDPWSLTVAVPIERGQFRVESATLSLPKQLGGQSLATFDSSIQSTIWVDKVTPEIVEGAFIFGLVRGKGLPPLRVVGGFDENVYD